MYLEQRAPRRWYIRNVPTGQSDGRLPTDGLIVEQLGRQSNLPQTVFTCAFPHRCVHPPFLFPLLQAGRISKCSILFSNHIAAPRWALVLGSSRAALPLCLDQRSGRHEGSTFKSDLNNLAIIQAITQEKRERALPVMNLKSIRADPGQRWLEGQSQPAACVCMACE